MRLQLAMNVSDLEESIDFYSKMFDTPPAKIKPGYANFAIENPPLKLVLFEGEGDGGTINHLGVEVETSAQVIEAEQRISEAGIQTTGVDDTMCCYADKTETWVNAPDNKWEWYVKKGDNEQFANVVMGEGSTCCPPEMAATEAATEEAVSSCC